MKNMQGAVGKVHRAHRTFRIVALGAAAALILPIMGSAWVVPDAGASGADSTPGTPQVPQPPTVVYAENFQNVAASGTPEPLSSYTSATGQGYTADPSWLPPAQLCNGWVLNSSDAVSRAASDTGCNAGGGATGNTSGANTSASAWFFLQQMTNQLGIAEVNAAQGLSITGTTTGVDPNAVASAQRDGVSNAAANNAVSSQTNAGTGAMTQVKGVQVQTTGTPVQAIPGHYYAVSAWFAEAHCSGDGTAAQNTTWANTNALEDLSLIINGDTANPVTLEKAYNPCTGTKVTGTYNTPIRVSFVQSSAVLLTTAENLGLQLYNERGGTTGNDAAFDLPEIVDVTPQVDKTFGTVDDPQTTIEAGVPVPMTFTITNTTELAAKDGWYFTDTMDPTLSIAPGTTPTTDCNDSSYTPGGPNNNPADANPNGTVQTVINDDGSTSLKVTGNLAQGMAYCTITAMVVSEKAGEFTNSSANFSDYAGLDLPSAADLDVTPPTLSIDKTITAIEYPVGTTDSGAAIAGDSKSASGLKAGDVVTYSYQVTNTSAVTLDDVWALEADPPGSTTAIHYPFNGTLPNGTPPSESQPGYATADELGASFNGSDTTPVIGSCVYDQDGAYGNKGASVDNGAIMLDPNESATCTATYVVTQTDVDAYAQGAGGPTPDGVVNTSVAIGTNYYTEDDNPSQQSASDTSTATITFDTTATLDVTKTPATQTMTAPGNVDWTVTATNSGKVTLSNVTVTDATMSNGGTVSLHDCYLNGDENATFANDGTESLSPGDVVTCTASYAVTQDDISAGQQITNTVNATGTDPSGDDINATPATADIEVATLRLQKKADTADLTVGDIVTYTFELTNTGSVPITGATIDDSTFNGDGSLSAISCPTWPSGTVGTINPNDTVQCTATYTVTQKDVDNYYASGKTVPLTNSATATGKDPSDDTVTSNTSSVELPSPSNASISLSKTPDKTTVTGAEQTVTYTIKATNDGTVTLSNVTVSDDGVTTPTTTTPEAVTVSPDCTVTSAAGVESPATNGAITLAPNEYVTCTATYTTSQADIDSGGPLTNHASVTGDDPSGEPATSDITSDVNVTQAPSLAITKSADAAAMTGNDVAGDTITYTFDVHNTGNVTISNISVDDSTQFTGADKSKLSAVTCTPTTLTPDQHASCEATYVVQQADVDAGSIDNTATVTGKDPTNTDTTADSDQVTVDFTHDPKLTIVKTADPTTVTAADQTVSYSFLITNEGNVTMTNIAVNETDFTGHGSPLTVLCPDADWSQDSTGTPVVGMLLPHASITCTATYTVTQEDIDAGSIDNTATASGMGPDGEVTSDQSESPVSVTQTPSLTITKSADAAAMTGNDVAGDTITYTFDVHNTGNVTISNISVDDSTQFTGADKSKLSAVTCTPTTLTPDQHASCEATYVVQQADVDAGSIDNTATVTGKDPTNTDITADSDKVTVDFTPNPELSLNKLVSPSDKASFTVGQELTYSFVVTNTGNVSITNLAINDAGTAPTSTTPGFTGAGALSAIDCGGVTTLVPQGTEAETGGVSSVTCTATYTIEQDDVDAGKIDNTAVATGKDPTDTDVTSNPSSAEMPGEPNPVVTLTKGHLAPPNPAAAGDTVTFTFVVKNMGNVTLDGSTLSIADTMTDISAVTCPASGSDWPNPDETLKPGESVTCSATYTLKQSDIDAGQAINPQAVATITPVNSTTPVDSEPADDTVTLTSTSDLTLDKSSTSVPTHLGDTISYSLVVTNSGATTISGVSVADTDFTGTGTAPVITCLDADWSQDSTGTPVVGMLLPHASITCTATYTVTQDDVDAGVVTNTAQAHGTDVNGPVDSNTSTKDVTITPTPSLTLDKTATPASVTAAGQTITYSFVVHNTGNVSLDNLVIDETQFTGAGGLSALSTPDCAPVALGHTLAPDATTTCTATYDVTQDDIDAGGSIDNTATASGTAPGATDPTTSHESSATVEVTQTPELTLAKSVTPSDKLTLDEELTYSFLVTNTGNVTITNLAIDDGAAYVDANTPGFSGTGTLSAIDCGGVTTLVPQGDPAHPAAGSSVTCTATYTVTQDDVNAGNVKNTATATGKDPSDTTITSDADQAMVPADQVPAVSLVKSHIDPSGPVKAGDTVTFLFTVNNSGNVSLDGDTFDFYDSLPTMSDVTCPASGQDWPNAGNHTLNPTQSVTCSATYELTQTDVDRGYVENQQATVTATPVGSTTPVTSDPAHDTVPLTSTPHLTLVKDSTSTPVNVGDTIDYTFTVTNDGDLTINDLVIAETAFSGTNGAPTATCDATTLAPIEHTTCTATYTVTQDDINAGFVNNTATATGTPEGADPTPVTSDESSKTIDFPSQPSLKLTKSATPTTDLTLGDTVTYSFLVENTGNVTVHGIQINETDFSGTGTLTGLNCPVTSLDSGATTTCTASYKITQADVDIDGVDNTATATGFSPSNTGTTPDVTSNQSPASVTTAQNPAISLTKTHDALTGTPKVGDVVTYRFTVVNTGDVTLTHVGVTDPGPTNGTGTLSAVTCDDTTLVPQGAETETGGVSSTTCTATYTLTQADIDNGSLDNTATATGTPPMGSDVTDDDSDTVTLTPDPKLAVTKSANPTSISAPGDVAYTITVTNTGNVTLDPLAVTDPGPVGGHGTMTAATCDDTKLVPQGAETETGGVSSTTCTATYGATQDDIDVGTTLTNTVTATGTAPDNTKASSTASADVTVSATPAISLTKNANPTSVSASGDVTYTFTVSNDGNTTLNDISVTDPGPAGGDGTMTMLGCQATSLLPHTTTTCTATYHVTQVDIDAGADLVNSATASGTPAGSTTPLTSDPAEATVTIDQQPSLDLAKSADPSSAMPLPGQTITYTFVVTNNGNVTVSHIAIDDTAFSGSDPMPTPSCDVTTLAPTEQAICTATYTVTQTDFDAGELTNEAVATGTDTNDQPVTSDPSDARVPADQTTSVSLAKSHDAPTTPAAKDDTVTFNFAVTNTGLVTLDVATLHIADTMSGLSAVVCPTTGTLVHGQSVNCTATYALTQADVDNRSIYNPSAIATIDDVNGKTATSDPVDDTVPLTGSSALTLEKTVTPDTASAMGDVVTYSFEVTNTGTYTLKNIVIDETEFSGTGTLGTPNCQVTELAPQTSTTCTVSYTLTQDDVDAGTVTNTAIAKGDAPDGSTKQSSPSSATVTITPAPAFTITKSADATAMSGADVAGDTVTYSFTVHNSGNVTISGIAVADSTKFSGADPSKLSAVTCTPTSLAPGEDASCTATYVVQQEDVDTGSIVNTATVSGNGPDGTPISPVDSNEVTVPFTPAPSLTLVKNATDTGDPAVRPQLGDQITYKYTVTNNGNVTISNISIDDGTRPWTDDQTVGFSGTGSLSSITCEDTSLAPHASTICTTDSPYVVTQADVNSQILNNTAVAQGTAPGTTDLTYSNPDSVTIPQQPVPELTLTKTANPASTMPTAGGTVTYQFKVLNSGNVTMSNISIDDGTRPWTDDQTVGFSGTGSAPQVSSCTYNDGTTAADVNKLTLDPGDWVTCTADYAVTQTDFDTGTLKNTAQAQGYAPNATDPTPSNPSSVTLTSTPQPALTVDKIVSSATLADGSGPDSSASGIGTNAVTGTHSGDKITYQFVVTNTGNVTLTDVNVTDPMLAAAGITISCPATTLVPQGDAASPAAGSSTTCTASGAYVAPQPDIDAGHFTNTATATGSSPTGSNVTNTSQASVTITPAPAITIIKSVNPTTVVASGDQVTYSFTVANTGDVTLTNVSVSDPMLTAAGITVSCADTTLVPQGNPASPAAGSSTTCTTSGPYTASQADINAGSFTNTATGTGKTPTGANVTDTNSATVTATPAPAITIVKHADVSTVTNANDKINYTFTVTNIGNVTLDPVSVDDPMLDAAGLSVTCDATSLLPKASTDCAASGPYVVSQAQIDANAPLVNTATATGTPPNHGTPVTNTDKATVTPNGAAKLTLVKTADQSNHLAVGTAVTYSFVVTNIGNLTINNIAIDDSTFDGSGSVPTITCPATTLAPGASTLCTSSAYTVTQDDVNLGHLSNTATATGKDLQGNDVTSNDSSWNIPQPAVGELTVTKDATESSVSAAGNTVHYTLTATNTTNVTLTGVIVSDGGVTNSATPATTTPVTVSGCYLDGDTTATLDNSTGFRLEPGDVATCTATYTATQADIDAGGQLSNPATATGTRPDNTAVDSNIATVDVPIQPTTGLAVLKTPSPQTVTAAGNVSWTISATNTGSATLNGVKVSDPAMSNGNAVTVTSCTVNSTSVNNTVGFTLAPKQAAECTATYTVTAADITAGRQLTNTATASGTAIGGTVLVNGNDSTATVDIATLAIAKTANIARVTAAGQTISYTITATNTGSVTLTNVNVVDAGVSNTAGANVSGPLSVTCPDASGWKFGVVGTLAPGDSIDCTASYKATQTDIDAGGSLTNQATASGNDPSGDHVTTTPAQVTVPVQPSTGTLTVTKKASMRGTLSVGNTVTYSFVVTNTGAVTINDIAIDDSTFSGSSPMPAITCAATTLAPGDSTTCTAAAYTVTQDDVNSGHLSNTATATGTDSQGRDVTSNDSSWDIPQPADDSLVVTKVANQTSVGAAGDKVNYTITAVNNGNVTLHDVTVSDAGVTNGASPSVTTPLTVAGCYLNGDKTKTLDNTTGFILDPGDVATCTASYTATQPDIDAGGHLTNQASATGKDPSNVEVDSNEAPASVNVTPTNNLVVAKTPASQTVKAAGNVTWTVTATNRGSATLTGVKVADATMSNGGAVTLTGCQVGDTSVDNTAGFDLAPGATASCTATYSVTSADVAAATQLTNTANATGTGPNNTTVTAPNATATVDFGGLSISKSADKSSVATKGDVVTYTITATNTGNVTLTGVNVTDAGVTNGAATTSPLTITNCTVGGTAVTNGQIILAAHDVATCTVQYTATQADIDAGGNLANAALASSRTPDGQTVLSNTANATVNVTPTTGLQVTKTTATQTVSALGDVSFTITAMNTGTATLTGVKVADPGMSNGSGPLTVTDCQIGTASVDNTAGFDLAPNATVTCQATYTVTQDDLNAGGTLTNTANATGTGPNNTAVKSNDATATVSITQNPELTLLKTADDNNALTAGGKVNYSFLVTNTGNVTVSNITIDDSTFSGSPAVGNITCPTTTLAPTESTTCTADAAYTVRQADVNAGTLSNTATANGTAPDGNTPVPSGPSSWNIPQTPNASVAIVETPSQASGLKAGDKLTFDVTATNNGNVTLTNVTVANLAAGWTGTGPMPDIDPTSIKVNGVAVVNGQFTLNPGDQVTYTTLPYTVLQADVDNDIPLANQASVVGTPPSSAGVVQVTANTTASATIAAASAHVAITETPSQSSGLKAGDPLTFNIVATNNGNVTLNNVFIANDPASWTGSGPMPGLTTFLVDGVPVVNGQFSLAPGQSVTCVTTPYIVTQADVNAGKPISNRATVTGNPPRGLNLAAVSAAAAVPATTVAAPVPAPAPTPAPTNYVVQTGGTLATGSPIWALLLLAAIGVVIGAAGLRRRSQQA